MIKLKYIRLQNFISHKDTQLEFNDKDKLLISGKSGSGKSSIIEAILWVLYGKARVPNRDLVKRGEDKARVTLEMESNNDIFSIEREINKSAQSITLYKNGDILDIKSIAEKEIFIENEILKCPYLLFVNSIIYPQDNPDSFVNQSASDRKDILLKLVDVDTIDEFYEKAKGILSTQETLYSAKKILLDQYTIDSNEKASKILSEDEIKALNDNIIISKQSMATIEKTINDFDGANRAFEAYFTTLSNLELKILKGDQKVADIIKNISTYKDTLEINKKEYELIDIKKLESLEEEHGELLIKMNNIKEVNSKWDEWNFSLIKLKSTLQNPIDNSTEIKKYEDLILETTNKINTESVCEHCGKPVEKLSSVYNTLISGYKTKIESLKQEVLDRENKYNETKKSIELLEAAQPEKIDSSDITNKIIEINNSITNIKSNKEKLENAINSNTTLVQHFSSQLADEMNNIESYKKERVDLIPVEQPNGDNIDKLRDDIKKLKEVIDVSEKTIYSHKVALDDIESINNKISSIQQELIQIQESINDAKLMKEVFGSTGIKTIVLDYILPLLEEKINSTLNRISDFSVRLDTQKDNASKTKKIEGMYITITNPEGFEMDFQSFSGGEKTRLIYAITEGIASILNNKFDFRVQDESIQGLDEDMLLSFTDVIYDSKNNTNQFICISHLPQIQDLFAQQIEIVKKNGDSIINIK